ncbi:MAG TPA: PEGA domain-containing protein [Candidatus Nanoarchaeia archaeon]
MKKLLIFILASTALIFGFFIFNEWVSPLLKPATGRLSVDVANQKAKVFLDNNFLGTTPFYAANLRLGDYVIEVDPESSGQWRWKANLVLTDSTLSVVDIDLASSQLFSSGESMYFRSGEKGISVIVRPTDAFVAIDSQNEVKTPVNKNLEKGVHTLTVRKEGYLTRDIAVNIEEGFKLNVIVYLAADPFKGLTKIDNGAKASLFTLYNSEVDLSKSYEDWAAGIKHLQENFSGAQTRFDTLLDPNGKVYILDQTEWNNKVALKTVVNAAYLGKKENDTLTDKAKIEWEKLKKLFN